MKVREFTRLEDSRYVRMVSSTRGSKRAVLAKTIVGGEIVFSAPLITLVPRLLAAGWQQVRLSKRGPRRLRHVLRVIK
jgi:class 3 adenylate cyclase